MGILPDAETLRGQGYPAFAVEKGSLICTRHSLIDYGVEIAAVHSSDKP